jgi:hypothetical protein
MLSFSVTYGGSKFDTAYGLAWAFGNPSGKLYVVGSSTSFNPSLLREGTVAMLDENLGTPSIIKKVSGLGGWSEFYDVAVLPIGSPINKIAGVGYFPHNNRDPVAYWLDQTTLDTSAAQRLTVFSGLDRDEAVAVSFDNQGNTIIAGFSESGGAPLDGGVPFLFKLDPNLNILWSVAFRPTESSVSYIGGPGIRGGLAIDSNNNIIVAGSAVLPGKSHDAFVAKFNPYGNIVWYKTFGGNDREHAYGVALDDLGNIYVAGSTNSFSSTGTYDTFVAKFDSNGN